MPANGRWDLIRRLKVIFRRSGGKVFMHGGRGFGKRPFSVRSNGIAVDLYSRSNHVESRLGQITTGIVRCRLLVQTNSGIVA